MAWLSRLVPSGSGGADVLDVVRNTHFVKQRVAPLGCFRRTSASWAHDKGVPGKVVAQLMGHTNADVTINVYTQVLDASLRTAVDRTGSELFTIVHDTETGSELSR